MILSGWSLEGKGLIVGAIVSVVFLEVLARGQDS